MNDNPEILTTHQAAEILGVTPITVIRWIKKGAIPCMTTLGGHRRIKVSDVERLVKENSVNNPLKV